MKVYFALLVIVLVVGSAIIVEAVKPSSAGCLLSTDNTLGEVGGNHLLVGGQNATWFGAGQYPKLYLIYPANHSTINIPTFEGEGTIWNGAHNGTTYLISGWGNDEDGANPPIQFYNNQMKSIMNSTQPDSNSSWYGGDVFAASYNGKEWLLSGMGSGALDSFSGGRKSNHMSLALFNGTTFTDLSNLIPRQHWGILYSNAWNGQYWLVGGGYSSQGTLFASNGTNIVDLTTKIQEVVPTFGPVTKVAWNKHYWLIGGYSFLAKYNGREFSDLTPQLTAALTTHVIYSVNEINWNGYSWLLAGGMPKAITHSSTAWIATLQFTGFTDLSNQLPCYVTQSNSSILTASFENGMWVLGGYVGKRPLLLLIQNNGTFDISAFAKGMTYVIWVQIITQQQHQQPVSD